MPIQGIIEFLHQGISGDSFRTKVLDLEAQHRPCPAKGNVGLSASETTLQITHDVVQRGALTLVDCQCPGEPEGDLFSYALSLSVQCPFEREGDDDSAGVVDETHEWEPLESADPPNLSAKIGLLVKLDILESTAGELVHIIWANQLFLSTDDGFCDGTEFECLNDPTASIHESLLDIEILTEHHLGTDLEMNLFR